MAYKLFINMICSVVLSVMVIYPIAAFSFLPTSRRQQLQQQQLNYEPIQATTSGKFIDLRSDTVTKPSNAMRKAIFEAEVGDDVFEEDPTVNKLEYRVASMFGKESSLFFPTGTMSNLAATMSWCGSRGSEVIVGSSSHVYLYEQSNIAQIAGVSPHVLPNQPDGTIDLNSIEKGIRANNIHFPITELISIENTHNYCGGRIISTSYMQSLNQLAKSKELPVHLDGARIWNAASASGTPLSKLVENADSISACLSKGLGAPAGSMLIGPKTFIAKARRMRKALGGGMRQTGLVLSILAAAGLQALDDFEAGLLEGDHCKARLLAEQLSDLPGILIDTQIVDTNIILMHLEYPSSDPVAFAMKLKAQGVLVLPFGARTIRLVTHRDVVAEDVPHIVNAFREVSAQEWLAHHKETDIVDGQNAMPFHAIGDDVGEVQSKHHSDSSTVGDNLIDAELVVVDHNSASISSSSSTDERSKGMDDSVEIVLPSLTFKSSDNVGLAPPLLSSSPLQSPSSSQSVIAKVDNNNNDINKTNYEEVRIFGMTVSPEGFCVLLQGLICDRILKVLVTPQDPMSDGLDRDEVETSEAVTLLQLLQGIDVETYLAKDALSVHVGNDNKHKYSLRQVTIKEVDPKKKFSGCLLGKQKRLSDVSEDSDVMSVTPFSSSISSASIPTYANSVIPTTAMNQENRREDGSIVLETAAFDEEVATTTTTPTATTALSSSGNGGSTTTSPHNGSNGGNNSPATAAAAPLSEVKVNSAFFAIALALRHNTAIVVRSDLLFDDELSYTTDEIRSYYPKMVETASFIPKIDNRGQEYVMNRMVSRYQEAVRQRNEEKIRQLEPYILGSNNAGGGGGSYSSSNGTGNGNGSGEASSSVGVATGPDSGSNFNA